MFGFGLVLLILGSVLTVILGLYVHPKAKRRKLLFITGPMIVIGFSMAYLTSGVGTWGNLAMIGVMCLLGMLCVWSMVAR